MQIMPIRMLSQFLNSLLPQKFSESQQTYTSKGGQHQTLGGDTVDNQKVYEERMDEFRNLAKDARSLKLPRSNGFTAYPPSKPIGGDLL